MILFCYLQLLDIISTSIFLKLGVQEANIFVNGFAFDWHINFGSNDTLFKAIIFKVVFVALLFLYTFLRRCRNNPRFREILLIANWFYAIIVVYNLIIIMRVLGYF